jgi:hypothetical protein
MCEKTKFGRTNMKETVNVKKLDKLMGEHRKRSGLHSLKYLHTARVSSYVRVKTELVYSEDR